LVLAEGLHELGSMNPASLARMAWCEIEFAVGLHGENGVGDVGVWITTWDSCLSASEPLSELCAFGRVEHSGTASLNPYFSAYFVWNFTESEPKRVFSAKRATYLCRVSFLGEIPQNMKSFR